MTSSNSYSSLYPFPFDLNQDDPHQHHHLFTFKSQPPPPPPPSSSLSSSSSSSLTCPIPFNPTHVQDQQAVHHQREPQQFHDQLQEKIYVPQDGPVKSTDCDLKLSIWKNEERLEAETHQSNENISSAKWMPSKMRILRKMMSSDHKDLSNNSKPKPEDDQKQQQPPSPDTSLSYSNNNTIRVCSDCNTTKTPLWRSGPRGPKSLCNACGIRQRKARRAMAAAAAANGPVVAAETPAGIKSEGLQHKAAKRSSNSCVPGFKKNKKCKHNSQSRKKKNLRLEELRIILSKNSAFHQVFPQDEKEAAILLMALSYGLVHG